LCYSTRHMRLSRLCIVSMLCLCSRSRECGAL
jgi:hypothetical protein